MFVKNTSLQPTVMVTEENIYFASVTHGYKGIILYVIWVTFVNEHIFMKLAIKSIFPIPFFKVHPIFFFFFLNISLQESIHIYCKYQFGQTT